MSQDEFWINFAQPSTSLDLHLQARDEDLSHKAMRLLTDKGRSEASLGLPVEAGARVSFLTNLGTVMAYEDPPKHGVDGTVVTVKTPEGHSTSLGDKVFVKFDDGRFMDVHKEHLRRSHGQRLATNFVRRALTLGDLTGFIVSGSKDELVHKATNDLWSLTQDDEGTYTISRLFDDTGEPLKG